MNKTQKVMTGCFAENNERLEMDQIEQDQPRHLLASKNQNREKKAGHVHARYSVVPKQPKNSFVVREAEGFVDPDDIDERFEEYGVPKQYETMTEADIKALKLELGKGAAEDSSCASRGGDGVHACLH